MADNYLERRQEDYERRKAKWNLKKKHVVQVQRNVEKPEDEAL
ncbi:dehydrogenase [Xylanibacter caecicola]|nr:dehydrogenase [Xylanibacter caecicola]